MMPPAAATPESRVAAARAAGRDRARAWLEPHDQEKQRHQALVDPVTKVHRDPAHPHADSDRRRPYRLIGVPPRRVRPQQRRDRAPNIANPPPVSVLRKLRTGAAKFRAQAVRPSYSHCV